jgi:hypothetical protein
MPVSNLQPRLQSSYMALLLRSAMLSSPACTSAVSSVEWMAEMTSRNSRALQTGRSWRDTC